MKTVEDFLDGLNAETAATVNALRSVVAASHAGLTERIKWNAPSFAVDDDDRITLGIERRGGVRIVFHRGTKPKDVTNFRFDDSAGLATWVAPDRGVIVFMYAAAVEEKKEVLHDICRRWINQTT